MKRNNPTVLSVLSIVIISFLILACGATSATATPLPTNTALPTSTNTVIPIPTATPMPTETEIPMPTPAPVGVPVKNENYEVTVVSFRKLNTVYLDAQYQWVPKPGYKFMELGVKVRNVKADSQVNVPWSSMKAIELGNLAVSTKLMPGWAGYKAVESGVEVNPKNLTFKTIDKNNIDEQVTFDNDLFLRLIYIVDKGNPQTTIWFSFDESPMIEIIL